MDKTITLSKEFIEYCKLNDINDIDKFVNEVFQRGFTIMKYGAIPNSFMGVEVTELKSNHILEPAIENVADKINKKDIYGE